MHGESLRHAMACRMPRDAALVRVLAIWLQAGKTAKQLARECGYAAVAALL